MYLLSSIVLLPYADALRTSAIPRVGGDGGLREVQGADGEGREQHVDMDVVALQEAREYMKDKQDRTESRMLTKFLIGKEFEMGTDDYEESLLNTFLPSASLDEPNARMEKMAPLEVDGTEVFRPVNVEAVLSTHDLPPELDEFFPNALMQAVRGNQKYKFRELISTATWDDCLARDGREMAALSHAVSVKHTYAAISLIERMKSMPESLNLWVPIRVKETVTAVTLITGAVFTKQLDIAMELIPAVQPENLYVRSNCLDYPGINALMIAILNKLPEDVALELIKNMKKAPETCKSHEEHGMAVPAGNGMTVLHMAAKTNSVTVLTELLEILGLEGCNVRDNALYTPLMSAIASGAEQTALKLIEFMNMQDSSQLITWPSAFQETILVSLAINNLDVVRALLQKEVQAASAARSSKGSGVGSTTDTSKEHRNMSKADDADLLFIFQYVLGHVEGAPLSASGREREEIALIIFDAMVDNSQLYSYKDHNLNTALHMAAFLNMENLVKKLLKGITSEALCDRNKDGCTALSWAASEIKNQKIALRIFNKMPKNPEAYLYKENPGATALFMAARSGMGKLVKRLLKRIRTEGVDHRNVWGTTALVDAAAKGKEDVALMLVDAMTTKPESYLYKASNTGMTALSWAAATNQVRLVKKLLEQLKKENMDAVYHRDKRGNTALDLARSNGHDQIVSIIEKYLIVDAIVKAASNGIMDAVSDLVEHVKQESVESALHVAREIHVKLQKELAESVAKIRNYSKIVTMLEQFVEKMNNRDEASGTEVDGEADLAAALARSMETSDDQAAFLADVDFFRRLLAQSNEVDVQQVALSMVIPSEDNQSHESLPAEANEALLAIIDMDEEAQLAAAIALSKEQDNDTGRTGNDCAATPSDKKEVSGASSIPPIEGPPGPELIARVREFSIEDKDILLEFVTDLISRHPDVVEYQDEQDGNSALHILAEHRDANAISRVIICKMKELKIDFDDFCNDDGDSAATLAELEDNTEFNDLLSCDAEPSLANIAPVEAIEIVEQRSEPNESCIIPEAEKKSSSHVLDIEDADVAFAAETIPDEEQQLAAAIALSFGIPSEKHLMYERMLLPGSGLEPTSFPLCPTSREPTHLTFLGVGEYDCDICGGAFQYDAAPRFTHEPSDCDVCLSCAANPRIARVHTEPGLPSAESIDSNFVEFLAAVRHGLFDHAKTFFPNDELAEDESAEDESAGQEFSKQSHEPLQTQADAAPAAYLQMDEDAQFAAAIALSERLEHLRIQNTDGETALILSARTPLANNAQDQKEVIDLLLNDLSADKDVCMLQDRQGNSALHYLSADANKASCTLKLVDIVGEEGCTMTAEYGITPLINSVNAKTSDVALKMLEYLKRSPDICRVAIQGKTALTIAVENNMVDVVKKLLDIIGPEGRNYRNAKGHSALWIGITRGSTESCFALLDHMSLEEITMAFDNLPDVVSFQQEGFEAYLPNMRQLAAVFMDRTPEKLKQEFPDFNELQNNLKSLMGDTLQIISGLTTFGGTYTEVSALNAYRESLRRTLPKEHRDEKSDVVVRGLTPLMHAIDLERLDIALAIIEKMMTGEPAQFLAVDSLGQNALHYATYRTEKNLSKVKIEILWKLIPIMGAEGCSQRNIAGQTPLHRMGVGACEGTSEEADETKLIHAMLNSLEINEGQKSTDEDCEIAEEMRRHAVERCTQPDANNDHPLRYLCRWRNVGLALRMIQLFGYPALIADGNSEMRDGMPESALYLTSKENLLHDTPSRAQHDIQEAIMKVFIKHRHQWNSQCDIPLTLKWAVDHGYFAVARPLIEEIASVKQCAAVVAGNSLLMLSLGDGAPNSNVHIALALINKFKDSADLIGVQGASEMTPLHYAIERGLHPRVVYELIMNMSIEDIEMLNGKSQTALEIAEQKSDSVSAKWIRQRLSDDPVTDVPQSPEFKIEERPRNSAEGFMLEISQGARSSFWDFLNRRRTEVDDRQQAAALMRFCEQSFFENCRAAEEDVKRAQSIDADPTDLTRFGL